MSQFYLLTTDQKKPKGIESSLPSGWYLGKREKTLKGLEQDYRRVVGKVNQLVLMLKNLNFDPVNGSMLPINDGAKLVILEEISYLKCGDDIYSRPSFPDRGLTREYWLRNTSLDKVIEDYRPEKVGLCKRVIVCRLIEPPKHLSIGGSSEVLTKLNEASRLDSSL